MKYYKLNMLLALILVLTVYKDTICSSTARIDLSICDQLKKAQEAVKVIDDKPISLNYESFCTLLSDAQKIMQKIPKDYEDEFGDDRPTLRSDPFGSEIQRFNYNGKEYLRTNFGNNLPFWKDFFINIMELSSVVASINDAYSARKKSAIPDLVKTMNAKISVPTKITYTYKFVDHAKQYVSDERELEEVINTIIKRRSEFDKARKSSVIPKFWGDRKAASIRQLEQKINELVKSMTSNIPYLILNKWFSLIGDIYHVFSRELQIKGLTN